METKYIFKVFLNKEDSGYSFDSAHVGISEKNEESLAFREKLSKLLNSSDWIIDKNARGDLMIVCDGFNETH